MIVDFFQTIVQLYDNRFFGDTCLLIYLDVLYASEALQEISSLCRQNLSFSLSSGVC